MFIYVIYHSSTRLLIKKLYFFLTDCIHTKDVPDDVFDLYCWIHSTYTIPRALSLHVGTEVAHPGVMASNVDEEEERRYVSYYQWVGFCLFFQVNRHLHKYNNHKYIIYNTGHTIYSYIYILLFAVYPILYTTVAMEELGGGKDYSPPNGLRRRSNIRSRKETKEKTPS